MSWSIQHFANAGHIHKKAFSVRFGFDDVKLRKFTNNDSQKQGNENAP